MTSTDERWRQKAQFSAAQFSAAQFSAAQFSARALQQFFVLNGMQNWPTNPAPFFQERKKLENRAALPSSRQSNRGIRQGSHLFEPFLAADRPNEEKNIGRH